VINIAKIITTKIIITIIVYNTRLLKFFQSLKSLNIMNKHYENLRITSAVYDVWAGRIRAA
jgi:hypothetical protein